MLTNIDIDEELVAEAMKVSGARTKREVVDRALRDLVARARRPRLKDIFGRAAPDAYWPDYDPKAEGNGEPGSNRVEEGIPSYKLPPAPSPAPAKASRRKK